MKTQNSISGGKSSAYIAANYPADYNIFSLVRTSDKKLIFPDAKIRQIVSDKLGVEFIGTLEMDEIIYTILDLEQFIGKEIIWVTGKTFEESIIRDKLNGERKYVLPCISRRTCTLDMKIIPMANYWYDNIKEVIETRIGFRANEGRRVHNMKERCNENGLLEHKFIIGKHKNGNNKWQNIPFQKPVFPLHDNGIFKDNIEHYWKDKPVRFAYMNNCVGCFHRSELLLKHMSQKEPDKFNWFVEMEKKGAESFKNAKFGHTFKHGITYEKIRDYKTQLGLFDDDFNECDSGYCGL